MRAGTGDFHDMLGSAVAHDQIMHWNREFHHRALACASCSPPSVVTKSNGPLPGKGAGRAKTTGALSNQRGSSLSPIR